MNKANYKKVLFIAYLFPPVGGGGVQRSSKFVKYLPEFEWQPLVLTVKEPYDFYRDDSLMNDLGKDIKVYRTLSIEPMKWVRKILKRRSKRIIEQKEESKHTVRKSLKPGFLVKLKTYLLIPDNEILWLPFAVWRGWRVIRKERPAIIYSTASPFTDNLIALILSKISKIPWVADFRDLWVDRPNFPKNKFRLFIDRKLEKMVIKNANHIVTVTSVMAERFKELYPGINYTSITNGYDEDDFKNIEVQMPPAEEFRITYTGIMNEQQNPGRIFRAISNLLKQRADFQKKIKLRFIGQLDNPGDFENINYFRQIGLDQYSELIEYQPHHHAIAEMRQSTILLLLIGEYPHSESVLTGKIFEYVRAGRPILAAVPPSGLAAEVIRNTNSGLVVSNINVDDIKEGISKMFDLFIANKLEQSFKRNNIEKYSRLNLTRELSDVFNKTIKLKSSYSIGEGES
ncbi:MAG: glycosyltransferase [Ignavibacteriaceae bacterium]|jgi:glycosyltransferase involved in cell wall biosynthesis